MYVQFITKVIQHVGALDTAVRDVSAQEVLQTIKDRNCKYITGVDNTGPGPMIKVNRKSLMSILQV